jgi:uncharacterized integral membrane protein
LLVAESKPRLSITPRLVAGSILVAAMVVFIAENTRRTRIRFIVPVVTAPVWTALFVATAVGVLAGALIARHRRGGRSGPGPPEE